MVCPGHDHAERSGREDRAVLRIANQRVVILALLGLTLTIPAPAEAEDVPIGRGIGQRVPNFTLKDVTTGTSVSLYGYRGKKAVVIVFTGVDCPIGNLYLPRLVALSEAYKDKGVAFLAINANASESEAGIAEHARQYGVGFPVLKDTKRGHVTDQLQAKRTCEALVIDGTATLRYRGAIDDQYDLNVRKDEPSRNYLVKALDAILSGEPIETTATTVVGCPIERADVKTALEIPRIRPASSVIVEALERSEPTIDPDSIGPVNYAEHVASILQNRCQSCHRPGEVGPFSLLNYDQAKRWAASIYEVVDDRRMPPWHADPRFGHFGNDRHLSPRERATLMAWVEQGVPEGDPKLAPTPRSWPEGWLIGTPDAVFEMPESYEVAAEGTINYQHFRVKTNFQEDKWVQAIEPRPGDRSVVHHIIVYLLHPDAPAGERRLEHLAGYAPGEMPSIFPDGVAKRIPAGAELVFEVHYTPIGKIKTDRSKVGMIFAKTTPKQRAITRGIANTKFVLEPGEENAEVKSRFVFPREAQLLSFMPHMHLRGKDFKYTATYPDGSSEVLLSVPAYDFAWQSYYRLAEPKTMPKGTIIDCVAHFDNSEKNPANPDPEVQVRWGQQTWEEMMIGYIDYVVPIDVETASVSPRRSTTVGVLGFLQNLNRRIGGIPTSANQPGGTR